MISRLRNQYEIYIRENKLKTSKRRDLIFDYILKSSEHFTIDNVYHSLVKTNPDIGIATVYRTIRLLVECGILLEHSFGAKKGFYEVNNSQSQHHGHLICRDCGKIVEFQYDDILEFQKSIARTHEFNIDFSKLEIYGICSECQKHE